jgi:hypothetical protein
MFHAMQREPEGGIHLSTGEPWLVSLSLARVGADYLCRIEGGDDHVGAVALSEWHGDSARTRVLTVEGHRETAIARHAAHLLCTTTRRTVVCVAGIHFDEITRAEIEDVSTQACALAERTAETLGEKNRQRKETR